MHDGNLLLAISVLPLLFGIVAYALWGRGGRHRFLYFFFVTMAYFFCHEFIAGIAVSFLERPMDAYSAVHGALIARAVATLGSLTVCTPLAWKLGKAMAE